MAPGRRDRALDLTDRKILSALRSNARLSPCWTRGKRLEATGVIEGYAAVIDHRALGLSDVVFVQVTLDTHSGTVLEKFGEALSRIPEIIEAYLVAGEYDYLVKVAVANTSDYERFLRDRLYKIEGVGHTRSVFALRALKKNISVDPMLIQYQA